MALVWAAFQLFFFFRRGMQKYGSVGGMSCVLVQFRDSIRINGYIGITCSAYSVLV